MTRRSRGVDVKWEINFQERKFFRCRLKRLFRSDKILRERERERELVRQSPLTITFLIKASSFLKKLKVIHRNLNRSQNRRMLKSKLSGTFSSLHLRIYDTLTLSAHVFLIAEWFSWEWWWWCASKFVRVLTFNRIRDRRSWWSSRHQNHQQQLQECCCHFGCPHPPDHKYTMNPPSFLTPPPRISVWKPEHRIANPVARHESKLVYRFA